MKVGKEEKERQREEKERGIGKEVGERGRGGTL